MEPGDTSLLFCSVTDLKGKPSRLKKRDLLEKVNLSRRFSKIRGINLQSTFELIAETKELSKRLKASILKQHLFCMICNDYFVNPVATACSHTFCEKCIIEFAEKYGRCFQCDVQLYRAQIHAVKSIETSVSHFVSELNSEYRQNYERKIQAHSAWRQTRRPVTFRQGDLIDVLGCDGYWRKGRIVKVILNQNHANTLQIVDHEDGIWTEMVCQNSDRLSRPGAHQTLECEPREPGEDLDNELHRRHSRSNYSELLQWLLRTMQTIVDGPSGGQRSLNPPN